MWFLAMLEMEGGVSANWAREFKLFLSETDGHSGVSNHMLLALIAEYIACVRKHLASSFDHSKAVRADKISCTAGNIENMMQDWVNY